MTIRWLVLLDLFPLVLICHVHWRSVGFSKLQGIESLQAVPLALRVAIFLFLERLLPE